MRKVFWLLLPKEFKLFLNKDRWHFHTFGTGSVYKPMNDIVSGSCKPTRLTQVCRAQAFLIVAFTYVALEHRYVTQSRLSVLQASLQSLDRAGIVADCSLSTTPTVPKIEIIFSRSEITTRPGKIIKPVLK